MNRHTPRRLLVPLLLLAAGAAAAAPPVIDNPAIPSAGTDTLALRPVWQAGGGDDAGVLLGVPAAAARDAAGNVYVVDRQLATVHVFGPDGAFLRDIGREGDGPGELRRPGDVVLLPGGIVGVSQRFPGRVILLRHDGTPAGSLDLSEAAAGGFHALDLLRYRGGRLLCREAHMTRDNQTFHRELAVTLRDSTGGEIARLFTHSQVNDLSRPRFVERDGYQPPAALGPDGSVYLAPDREAYRIQVYDRDGRLRRIVTRAYRPRRRTAAEKRRVGQNMHIRRNGRDLQVEREVCDTDQAVVALHVAGDGTLWVLSSRGNHDLPDGILQRWDLFDATGRFVRQVILTGPADPEHDRLLPLDDGHWLLLRNVRDAQRALRGDAAKTGEEEAEPVALVLLAPSSR